MPVNIVIYGGEKVIDLTEDSIIPDALVEGYTAHDKSGKIIDGTNPYEKTATDAEIAAQADLIAQISAALDGKAGGGGIDTSDATATAEDIAEGATAYVNGEKITGTHACSSTAGKVVKTGTTTSGTISTGLSSIDYIVIYKSSVTTTGFIQGLYRADTGKTSYTYCSSYSTWSKQYAVVEDTNGSVSGGTFTWGGSSTKALNGTYNWIAVGTE